MNTQAAQPIPATVIQHLKSCLSSAYALNAAAIRARIDITEEHLLFALSGLVTSREVEVLRPVSFDRRTPMTLHPFEHYRMVYPMDKAHLWQVEVDHEHRRNARAEKIFLEVFGDQPASPRRRGFSVENIARRVQHGFEGCKRVIRGAVYEHAFL